MVCYTFDIKKILEKQMDQNQANEYIRRINTVCDYIEKNLGKDMTLKELACVAGFSEYHFHRIFSAMTGETLFSFIQRLRLERAAALLCMHNITVTEIAMSLCFSSTAVFSRVFKQRFGYSPTAYRRGNRHQKESNLGQLLRNDGKACYGLSGYNGDTHYGNTHKWRFDMKPEVSIETIDEMRVAYIRYVGPYAGDAQLFENLYGRLGAWAGPRGVDMSTSYIIYHDDPAITDEKKLRLSVCVPIGADVAVSGEICEMTIGGGLHGVGHFVLASEEYGEAWAYMHGQWLPQSGYQPRNQAPFERYTGECGEDGKMAVDICIPVEVMR